jgi:hypothetical protein
MTLNNRFSPGDGEGPERQPSSHGSSVCSRSPEFSPAWLLESPEAFPPLLSLVLSPHHVRQVPDAGQGREGVFNVPHRGQRTKPSSHMGQAFDVTGFSLQPL